MSIGILENKSLAVPQKTAIEVSLYNSINDVPQQDFLRFAPADNELQQAAYFKLIEQVKQGDMQFIYALVYKDGSLIGSCYFQIIHFKGTNLTAYFPDAGNNKFKNLAVKLLKSAIAKIDLPLLVSGNLFVTGEQGIYFHPNTTEFEKSFYLEHAIQQIFKQRKYLKTALLPDMYEPAGNFDSAFTGNKYQRIHVEADMSMAIPANWQTFDDYLQAISSKYRVRAKKIMHTSEALTLHELTGEDVEADIDRFYKLYRAVADKADFNIAKFPKEYFVAQKKLTPHLYHIFGYYLEGKLVGFMSMFILPHKTEVHYCGIDYTLNKDYALYQRMLYDTVKYAIEHNIRKLHFGRTAPEVKSTIGAIPHPMYGYIKHSNTFINHIMGLFTKRLKPRVYILRNPFK